jgi:hypothetical protein
MNLQRNLMHLQNLSFKFKILNLGDRHTAILFRNSSSLFKCLHPFQPSLIVKLPTMSVYAGRDERGSDLALHKDFSFLSVLLCVLHYFLQNTTHTIVEKRAVQTYRHKNKIPYPFFIFLRKFTFPSTCSCV